LKLAEIYQTRLTVASWQRYENRHGDVTSETADVELCDIPTHIILTVQPTKTRSPN
jgi:hypothetical protein